MTLTREGLVTAILAFLGGGDLLTAEDIRSALEHEVDLAGPDALVALHARLRADNGWKYYPPDPLARRIHHVLADRLLHRESAFVGIEHVEAVAERPVAVFGNHLSYADANLFEMLLHRSGGEGLARRLTAIAGPKIFSSQQRRFSSLCFGTVKVPQSADVATEEAALSAREVAEGARRSIEAAHERLIAGDALVLFGEGTRSRTRGMQRLLPGVARYLEGTAVTILPIGITGTEDLFPVGDDAVHPARVVVRAGRPFESRALLAAAGGDRRLIVDAIGLAIAELLSQEYRGKYAADPDLVEAGRVLSDATPAA